MTTHATKNAVPRDAKAAAIVMFNSSLAATIDLALAAKQAHWNMRGRQFIALHDLIDSLRTELDSQGDLLAERVVQLGETALGTLQAVTESSVLGAYPTETHAIADHLAVLAIRFRSVGNAMRRAIEDSAAAGDAVSADIFTGVARSMDKGLWLLEAHIEG